MKRVAKHRTAEGREPFSDWFEKLEWTTQGRIHGMIVRVACGGSKKNVKSVGSGVFEIKVDFGPGYRVYFGELAGVVVLLLLGGDKSTQQRDITKAVEFWKDACEKNDNF